MTGIAPIDQRLLPADVRAGSQADRDRYATALSFEKLLVTQLTQQLADTATPADDAGAGSGSPAGQAYRQMLPGVMADAVTAGGGLGIARQVYDGLKASGE